MQPERKLELMKKYDFSRFLTNIVTIELNLSLLEEEESVEVGEIFLNRIINCYNDMEKKYAVIDFYEILEEMDSKDYDNFATLFKTRELLPKLKGCIDRYVEFARSNRYYVPATEKFHQDILGMKDKFIQADYHKKIRYRERIESLEESLKRASP